MPGIFLAILLIQLQALPQEFQHYETRSGLSNNVVYDVFQDHKGFIWVGTENGLNRFDAYDFKTYYQIDGDPYSLPSNVVRDVFEDQRKNLWVSTTNGLAKLNSDQDSFIRYNIPDSLKPHTQDIQRIVVDQYGDFWFLEHDLYRFKTTEKLFQKTEIPGDAFSFDLLEDHLVVLSDGENGCYIIDTADPIVTTCRDKVDSNRKSIFAAPTSNTFTGNTTAALDANFSIEEMIGIPKNILPTRFFETKNGVKWVGTEQGLYVKSSTDTRYQKYNFGDSSNSLTKNIKSIFEDRIGGIWIGTLGGMFHFDAHSNPFKKLDIDGMHSMVMAIGESNGELMVNQFGEKTSRIPFPDSSSEIITDINPTLPSRVWEIMTTRENSFSQWLATDEGLFFYDASSNHIQKAAVPEEGKIIPVIFSLAEGKNHQVWAGGADLIYRFSTRSKTLNKIIRFPENTSGRLIQDLVELDDQLLIATENHGAFTYDEESGLGQIKGTSGITFWDIFISGDQRTWLAGSGGLFEFNSDNKTIDRVKDFRPNIIFSLTEDRNQFLWMGTDRGLIRFNPADKTHLLFNPSEKATPVEFNRRSILSTESGQIYAGSVEGLFYFDPSSITSNTHIPPVQITDFRIIKADTVTQLPANSNQLMLNWEENTFEVDFTALNYTNAGQNRYRYQLVGHDPEIRESNDIRTARYVRVPEGSYEFQVFGSNNDGIWNPEPASFQINIAPPFWRTSWFRFCSVLLIGFLFWRLYQFRVNQLLEVERIRLRIAGDLHDEIGSGLSGIALTGDLLNAQIEKGKPKKELVQRVADNARHLAGSLDAIVWLINPDKETLGDLVSKIRRVANEQLAKAEVNFENRLDEKDHLIELSSYDRRNVFLLMKEAIHNIAKHAEASKILIQFEKNKALLKIEISDNGKGFDPAGVEKGTGLDSMYRRARELNAKFMLKSGSTGTEIKLQKRLP